MFDIYDLIFKKSYPLLIRVFFNHIKVQFKEKNSLINSIVIRIIVKLSPRVHELAHKHITMFELFSFFFFLKCDLILQAKSREYNKNSVKQNNAANPIEHKELKKEG